MTSISGSSGRSSASSSSDSGQDVEMTASDNEDIADRDTDMKDGAPATRSAVPSTQDLVEKCSRINYLDPSQHFFLLHFASVDTPSALETYSNGHFRHCLAQTDAGNDIARRLLPFLEPFWLISDGCFDIKFLHAQLLPESSTRPHRTRDQLSTGISAQMSTPFAGARILIHRQTQRAGLASENVGIAVTGWPLSLATAIAKDLPLRNALLQFSEPIAQPPAALPQRPPQPQQAQVAPSAGQKRKEGPSLADIKLAMGVDPPPDKKARESLRNLQHQSVPQGPASFEAFYAESVKLRATPDLVICNQRDPTTGLVKHGEFVSVVKVPSGHWECNCSAFAMAKLCFHQRCAQLIEQQNQPPIAADNRPVISLRAQLWAVRDTGYKHAVVSQTPSSTVEFRCSSDWCFRLNNRRRWCPHVRSVLDQWFPGQRDEDKSKSSDAEEKVVIAELVNALNSPRLMISRRAVVYPLPEHTKQALRNADSPAGASFERLDNALLLKPTVSADAKCKCGLSYSMTDEFYVRVPAPKGTVVYFDKTCAPAILFALRCPNQQPSCTLHYEGDQHALRVCSLEIVISEAVFFNCLTLTRLATTSVSAFFEFQVAQYELYGSATFCSERTFREWYYAWLFRVETPTPVPPQCPICGKRPKLLCCDGSRFSLPKDEYKGQPVTSAVGNTERKVLRKRLDRCFVPGHGKAGKSLRKTLALIAGVRKTTNEKLAATDVQNCIAACPANSRSFIEHVAAARNISDASNAAMVPTNQLDPRLRAACNVLDDLSTESAIRTLVMPDLAEIIIERKADPRSLWDDAARWQFQQSAPCYLGELVAATLATADDNLIAQLNSFLQTLAASVLARVSMPQSDIQPVLAANPDPKATGVDYHFGGAAVRGRPRYDLDGKPKLEQSAGACNKAANLHKDQTGGVFTFFCEHGYCYGFHIVPEAEGRNDPFSVLYTLLDEAPDYLVYDFSCSLDEYATNRDSHFFRNTKFLIDRFHWKNHTSCSKAFCMNNYPALHAINSSICEQYHSFLSRVRISCTRMKQQTFMPYLRTFVNLWNARQHEKLRSFGAIA